MHTTRPRSAPLTRRSRAALAALVESGQVATDDAPHLPPADVPLVTPEKRVYFRVTENDVHRVGQGGRVVLQGLSSREDPRLIGATLTLVYRVDAPMWDFPALRADMEGTAYEITLREILPEQLPPDPTPPSPEERIRQLEQEKMALEAKLAESRLDAERGAVPSTDG